MGVELSRNRIDIKWKSSGRPWTVISPVNVAAGEFCIAIFICTPIKQQLCRSCVNRVVSRASQHSSHGRFDLSDEAHFRFSSEVNQQNCRYWSGHNVRELHERALNSPKVTVWCAILNLMCGVHTFFEENCKRRWVLFDARDLYTAKSRCSCRWPWRRTRVISTR